MNFKAPPKKSLGQHFLTDRGMIEMIVLAVNPQPGDRLVEIGPGQGAITLPLLRKHGELTAIEFDRDLVVPLSQAAHGVGQLTVIHKDVLEVDFTRLATALVAGAPRLSSTTRLVAMTSPPPPGEHNGPSPTPLPTHLPPPASFQTPDPAAVVRSRP